MASRDNTGPSEKKSTQVELDLGPKPEGSLDNTKYHEPVVSWDSEGTPSVDDAVSTDDDVCHKSSLRSS
jgi:hypothetical protein